MIREEIWWPDDLDPRGHEFVEEGTNIHGEGERPTPENHLYTVKQNREMMMWVCECGRTLTRYKQ